MELTLSCVIIELILLKLTFSATAANKEPSPRMFNKWTHEEQGIEKSTMSSGHQTMSLPVSKMPDDGHKKDMHV